MPASVWSARDGWARGSRPRPRRAQPRVCRPRRGSAGGLARLRGNRAKVHPFDADALSKALTRRATLTREWLQFFETYSVLLMPVSAELPFPNGLDLRDEASFSRARPPQLPAIAIPFMGLPARPD